MVERNTWKHRSKYYSAGFINDVDVPHNQLFVTKERYLKELKGLNAIIKELEKELED